MQVLDAIPQARRRFLQCPQNVAVLDQQRLPLGRRLLILLHLLDLRPKLIDPRAELLQLADHRLDSLRAQAKLFDQQHRPTAPSAQPLPSRFAIVRLVRLARGNAVIFGIALQQPIERRQVVRQPAEDLLLFQPIGHRDLHRAIERQFAAMHAVQHLDRTANHVVAAQQLAAERGAGDFDLPREVNFFFAREQRNLTHLREIHPHRVVRPRFAVAALRADSQNPDLGRLRPAASFSSTSARLSVSSSSSKALSSKSVATSATTVVSSSRS